MLTLPLSPGLISPFSISITYSSFNGSATTKSLLCLFGDYAKQVWLDNTVTVSLYGTTGSDLIISIFTYSSTIF